MKYLLRHLLLTIVMALVTVLVLSVRAHAAPSRETREAEVFTSDSPALTMVPGAKLQYFPAVRVWSDTAGTLLVCPHSAKVDIDYNKLCKVEGKKDEQAGWTPATDSVMPGYVLAAVQLSQTYKGPSLLLYWKPAGAAGARPSR